MEKVIGYNSLKLFYLYNGWKSPSIEEFQTNRVRTFFIKLEEFYTTTLSCIPIDNYLKYLCDNDYKTKDWYKKEVFYSFINYYIKTESEANSLQRMISFLKKYNKTFGELSVPFIASQIDNGNISLYYVYKKYEHIISLLKDFSENKILYTSAWWKLKIQSKKEN